MRLPVFVLICLVFLLGSSSALRADDAMYEREPIRYSSARADDPIARLQRQIEAGKATLAFDPKHGYLPALLKALEIPVSSQVLVFSKTSFQRDLIDPEHPRALYFNDDVY